MNADVAPQMSVQDLQALLVTRDQARACARRVANTEGLCLLRRHDFDMLESKQQLTPPPAGGNVVRLGQGHGKRPAEEAEQECEPGEGGKRPRPPPCPQPIELRAEPTKLQWADVGPVSRRSKEEVLKASPSAT